jgi:hypothetical protein
MAVTWEEPKDPNEVLDYSLDWQPSEVATGRFPRLDDEDTILTSTWSIISAAPTLEIENDSNDDTTTTVWLSGGTLGANYELLNRIVTLGGRTMDQTCKLKVRAK